MRPNLPGLIESARRSRHCAVVDDDDDDDVGEACEAAAAAAVPSADALSRVD